MTDLLDPVIIIFLNVKYSQIIPLDDSRALHQLLGDTRHTLVVVEHADHGYSNPECACLAVETVTSWLTENYALMSKNHNT